MFRWLFLNESALAPAEHAAWKISTLRILLVSGFILEAWVALHSSFRAVERGAYEILLTVISLYALKSVAIWGSRKYPRFSAALLLLNIYGIASAISIFTRDPELAKLGYLFVYITPILARIFFHSRLALILMLLNTIPYISVISGYSHSLEGHHPIPDAEIYIHTLFYFFFNICLPLAVFRILYALDATLVQYQDTSGALQVSHAQYQEVFENAGTALLLTDAYGQILQANQQANHLLGRNPQTDSELALFGWLSLDESFKLSQADEVAGLRTSAYRTRDGKLVALDNISQTSTEHYIVALRDVSGLHKMQHALKASIERQDYLSSHDALTNLPNRDMLRQFLQQKLENLSTDQVTALVSFRLNSVRQANQQYGAHTGDVLLRRFADELTQVLPKNCFCARLRSIVFSFVIDQLHSPADVVQFVDQIREAMPRELMVNGELLLVQFSAGIAVLRPEDKDPDELIRRSEVALDTSRRGSDQNVTLFDEHDANQIRRNVEIEVGILNGLKAGEFHLMYQPKVDRDGRVAGVEALIRWVSPTLGKVAPSEFIPIAERSGLVRQVSNFVIEQSCSQIRAWLDEFGHSPVVAINLAVSDIARPDLISLIDDTCARFRIATSYLELEITETGLIANEQQSIEHLNVLKNRGFGIAIDDFGTGYSSLSKLSHFPAHTVKIDRSFVAQIGYNRKSEMIVKAIVSLAEILACNTIAEGVENESQEQFLKEVGCQYFQGYLYYRPLDLDGMRTLLSQPGLNLSADQMVAERMLKTGNTAA